MSVFKKRKLLFLIVGAILVRPYQLEMDVQWKAKPTVFQQGDNVRLMCSGTKCIEKAQKLWRGGIPYNILSTETKSRNPAKYELEPAVYGSVLLIKNISIADLNCDYTCNCGFYQYTNTLSSSKHFLSPPYKNSIVKSVSKKGDNYHIAINMSNVYPEPSCRVTLYLQNENTTYDLEAVEMLKVNSFYNVKFNTVVDCNERQSKINVTIVCVLQNTDFNVFQETIDCYRDTARNDIHILVACLCVFLAAIGVVTAAFIIKRSGLYRKRSRQQMRHRNNEAIQSSDEMEIQERILANEPIEPKEPVFLADVNSMTSCSAFPNI